MTLNFGNNLFPSRGDRGIVFDFRDVLRGNSYVQFFGGKLNQVTSVDESYETGRDGAAQGSVTVGQTFTIGEIIGNETVWLSSVDLYLARTGTANNVPVDISIQALDGAGLPDGVDLATGGIVSFLDPAYDWYTIGLSKVLKLKKGEQYAMVVVVGQSGGVREANWGYDGSSPTYAGGSAILSGALDPTKDFLFKLNVFTSAPYTLFTNEFDSDPESESVSDVSFELDINITTIIEGFCLMNLNTNGQTDVKVEFFHVRSGVETSMGSNESVSDSTRKAMGINLTRTTFKKGDILKLQVSSATGAFTFQYTDLDATPDTTLNIWIPFVITE